LRGATLHANGPSGEGCAPSREGGAVKVSGAQNAIAALTQTALHGLEREATPLALHVDRRESLREDRHAPKVSDGARVSKSREGLDSSAPNSPFLDGGARVWAAPRLVTLGQW
jgi:hypothetical protein